MGQKQHKGGNKNLIIEINPINNYNNEMYIYNFKNSRNYKTLIPSSTLDGMLKIKSKPKLIEYIEDNNDITYKETNSIILSFTLNNNKYQIELYDMDYYKNILHLFIKMDYLFLSLIFVSLLSVLQFSKPFSFSCLRQIHFLIVCCVSGYYFVFRYYQICESYYYKLDYKIHFFCILFFMLSVLINAICFIGLIFITVNGMEKICLLGALCLQGSILYFWSEEQFEKNTYKEMKNYYYELKKMIIKKIKNINK